MLTLTLRKIGVFWHVELPSGTIIFRSMNKRNCQDWINECWNKKKE